MIDWRPDPDFLPVTSLEWLLSIGKSSQGNSAPSLGLANFWLCE